MARFQCPLCRVSFDGSIWDITPQAIGHSAGSHKIDYTEEDIRSIIAGQALGKTAEEKMAEDQGTTPLVSEVQQAVPAKDLTPEPVVPTTPLEPAAPQPEPKSVENLASKEQAIDAWWEGISKK